MPKKKSIRRKDTKKKRKAPRPKAARTKKRRKIRVRTGRAALGGLIEPQQKGLGVKAAGQSGDIEGLSGMAYANSESVEELAEEGQAFEAEVVAGVEEAENADESEVTTHEVIEDDVPTEYDRER